MRKRPPMLVIVITGLLFAGGLVALLAAQERSLPPHDWENLPFPEENPKPAPGAKPQEAPAAALGAEAQDLGLEQTLLTSGGVRYALSRNRGFLVSFDGGQSWIERNHGLSRRRVSPFTDNRVRRLTSLGVDPANDARVAVTMASEVFLSEDYGSNWVSVPLGKPLRPVAYFTSVALSPVDPNSLLLGTSFNGFYETKDRGRSWQDPSISAERLLNRGAGFYEEISGISYDPLQPGAIWFACGFGNGLYRGDRKSWNRVEFPGDSHGEIIQGLDLKAEQGRWALQVRTTAGRWKLELPAGAWQLEELKLAKRPEPDPFARERQRKAANRFGIYLSSYRTGEDLDRYIAFLKEHGLNSLVVDCKDDYGVVTYDTALELPKRVGAAERHFRLEQLLSKAHANGIYVIGRVVVFKDQRLYNYDGYRYALWSTSNQPWRHLTRVEPGNGNGEAASPADPAAVPPEPRYFQREYWVDPYSPFVWSYNAAIAEELQNRGVDEIQFDYIRFPSDGNLATIRYRFKPEGMDMIEAMESFLVLARQSIHIPVSTDLYGYCTWHRMGNWIGQSTEMLAEYVDVICPMYYPSHFPREFKPREPYLQRARQIYLEGTRRALSIMEGRSLVRPYVQAFLIGGELSMGVQEYSTYLTNQIRGCLEAPSSGFTLWNASNRYYMVTSSLKPLLPPLP